MAVHVVAPADAFQLEPDRLHQSLQVSESNVADVTPRRPVQQLARLHKRPAVPHAQAASSPSSDAA